jgi:hypothetical protein
VQPEVETTRVAACLSATGTFGDVYRGVPGPTAHVAPVYPLLLAGVYSLFGVGTRTALVIQAVLSSAVAAAAVTMTPRVANGAGLRPIVGWVTAWVLAVVPVTSFQDDISGCWEQPLAAVLLLLALLSALANDRAGPRTVGGWAAVGGLMGVIGLTSPAALPAAGLPLVLAWLRNGRTRWLTAAVACLAFATLIAPWTIRNQIVFGTPTPFRSNFGLELALGNNDEATGRTYFTTWADPDSPFHRLHPFDSETERQRLREIGEVAYMRAKRAEAAEWIAAHPERFLHLTIARLGLFWLPPPDLWGESRLGVIQSAVTRVYSAIGLLWLVVLLVRRHPAAGFLAGHLLGGCLAYAVTHVDLRYRYPVNAVLLMLAVDAAFAVRFFSRTERK